MSLKYNGANQGNIPIGDQVTWGQITAIDKH